MPDVTLTAEEFNALIAEREVAVTEREALRGELKVVKVERDLLQEKLNAFLRKLFGAKSEARGSGQSELFNEAEALVSAGDPVTDRGGPCRIRYRDRRPYASEARSQTP